MLHGSVHRRGGQWGLLGLISVVSHTPQVSLAAMPTSGPEGGQLAVYHNRPAITGSNQSRVISCAGNMGPSSLRRRRWCLNADGLLSVVRVDAEILRYH